MLWWTETPVVRETLREELGPLKEKGGHSQRIFLSVLRLVACHIQDSEKNKKQVIYICSKAQVIYSSKAASTSPGSNTPQDTNCTATCPLSRKLFKLGEPDMQDIAGEAEMNS